MINRFLLIVIFAVCSLLLPGCYYDKEETLYPTDEVCDTSGVTYASVIVPIMNESCISCHSGSTPLGNIRLDNYASVKVQALRGALYGSIAHDPAFSPMPQGGTKLSSCKIRKVKIWVDAGSPDN